MDVHSSCELPFGAVPCGSAPCARNRGRGPRPRWIAEPPLPAILQAGSQAHDGCSAILRAALQRTTLWERAMRAKSRAWPAPTVDCKTVVPCDSSDRSAGAGSMLIHQADRPSAHQLVGARHAREIAGMARSHSGLQNGRFLRLFSQIRGRMMDVHPSCELPFGALPCGSAPCARRRTNLWERAMRAKSRARPAPAVDRSRTGWAGRRSASAHHCIKLNHRSQGGGGSWSLGSSSALSAA
ncbi:hypothetical protein M2262_000459 [Pseudomonas sp. BIGb0408]|uniref:Uncharacterized protein n=1 Tax=Phytopseudomonas flavescens TaxID=29435 RepID=A0A7Y9XP76_9GAMM|nr:hypothetical protein [Pseudomonas sp. BIGb0408]NYH75018.1 hypothetical protein [Pseudomonas flavescens]